MGVGSLGDQSVVGGEPGPALGLAGPRSHPHPLQFPLQSAPTSRIGPVLGHQAGLLLLQPPRVVAFVGDAPSSVEFQDPSGHVVEEIAVVSDGYHGARIVAQSAFQPGHRFGVKMVGRLIEEQQVGLGEQ